MAERTPEEWAAYLIEKLAYVPPESQDWAISLHLPAIIRQAIADAIRQAVEAEREACAKVAEEFAKDYRGEGDVMHMDMAHGADSVAVAIRARKEAP